MKTIMLLIALLITPFIYGQSIDDVYYYPEEKQDTLQKTDGDYDTKGVVVNNYNIYTDQDNYDYYRYNVSPYRIGFTYYPSAYSYPYWNISIGFGWGYGWHYSWYYPYYMYYPYYSYYPYYPFHPYYYYPYYPYYPHYPYCYDNVYDNGYYYGHRDTYAANRTTSTGTRRSVAGTQKNGVVYANRRVSNMMTTKLSRDGSRNASVSSNMRRSSSTPQSNGRHTLYNEATKRTATSGTANISVRTQMGNTRSSSTRYSTQGHNTRSVSSRYMQTYSRKSTNIRKPLYNTRTTYRGTNYRSNTVSHNIPSYSHTNTMRRTMSRPPSTSGVSHRLPTHR